MTTASENTQISCEAFQASLGNLGEWRWSAAAQQHISECTVCRDLVRDLDLLARKLRQMTAPEPSPALWERIRFQLELEGIIHPHPQSDALAAAAPPPPSASVKTRSSGRSTRTRL